MGKKRAKAERKARYQRWLQRIENNPVPRTVEAMQGLLKGVTWQSFAQCSLQRRANVTFRARFGVHMGRYVIVIIGHKQFVAMRLLTSEASWRWMLNYSPKALNPAAKNTGQALTMRILPEKWERDLVVPEGTNETQ